MKLKPEKNDNVGSLVSGTGKIIPPSGIREFFDLVYSVPDCISLGVGEPDFTTPWRISDYGSYAIKDGHTSYTPNRGITELLELISEDISKKTGVNYIPDSEILVTMGVSQGLDLSLRSIINPGDEIIIIEPCYVSYSANITLAYGTPVIVPTFFKDNFKIDISKISKSVTQKTKAIILNYPANPTGMTIDKKTLCEIASIAEKNNLIVISDELYSSIKYNEEHFSILSIPGMEERTIYLNGFSKSHAMTGWRLGYIGGPVSLISIMLKIHQYTALCAPSMSQYAAIEALRHGYKDVERMRKEYEKRKNYIYNGFIDMGLPCPMPEGAFYLFPDVSPTGLNSREFAVRLLKSEKVAVVPGDVFGECGKSHIRCSYATSLDNIKEALIRIKRFINTI